jgi:hypothetical protein
MVTPELLDYIRSERAAGVGDAALAEALTAAGWDAAVVDEALAAVSAATPPVSLAHPVGGTPHDQPVTSDGSEVTVPVQAPARSGPSPVVLTIGIMTGVLVVGALAAGAYFSRSWLGVAPYQEDNLVTGLVVALSTVTTAAHTFEGSFAMVERESGMTPFRIPDDSESQQRAAYERDQKRVSVVMSLYAGLDRYVSYMNTFPNRLETLYETNTNTNTDTDAPLLRLSDDDLEVMHRGDISYELLPGRQGARLSVNMESTEAQEYIKNRLEEIAQYPDVVLRSEMNGSVLSLTRPGLSEIVPGDNSLDYYLWLPPQPKPFFVQMEEFLGYMPPRMKLLFGVSVHADFRDEDPDARVVINAEGDFDDLLFKLNADFINKDDTNYFRLNNFPSLYEAFLPVKKGKWYSFSTAAASGRIGAERDIVPQAPSKSERSVVTETAERELAVLAEFSRLATKHADDHRLLQFLSPPTKEMYNDEEVFRYTLGLNKDQLIPFMDSLLTSAETLATKFPEAELPKELPAFLEQVRDELKKDITAQVIDYLARNLTINILVTPEGMPVDMSLVLKAVPPDSVERLKDQQAVWTFRYNLAEVNEPVIIETPSDVTPLDALINDSSVPLNLQSLRSGTPAILGAFTTRVPTSTAPVP